MNERPVYPIPIRWWNVFFWTVIGSFAFFIFVNVAFTGGVQSRVPRSNQLLLTARTIVLAMFSYANDHDQNYPNGNSSTEVFQKLIDEKYLSDVALFYIPLPGKIPPVPGQKLKPENVSWDVTGAIDSNSPDELPVVFMTGYKVNYVPDGNAVPLIKPHPLFGLGPPAKSGGWVRREPSPWRDLDGIAVAYKSNGSKFLYLVKNPDDFVPHFVPRSFGAAGKVYRQLTPDRPLP